jgi:hypothetical protein
MIVAHVVLAIGGACGRRRARRYKLVHAGTRSDSQIAELQATAGRTWYERSRPVAQYAVEGLANAKLNAELTVGGYYAAPELQRRSAYPEGGL